MPRSKLDGLADKLHAEWKVQTGRTTWQALEDAKKAKRDPAKAARLAEQAARAAADRASRVRESAQAPRKVTFDYPG